MSVVQVQSILSGKTYHFDDAKHAGSGAVKDVYFAPDRSYVVQIFKNNIFQQVGGDYWESVYCWPTDLVEVPGTRQTALIAPVYRSEFFFEFGSANNDMLGIRGRDKEGKWFASATHQQTYLDPRERGNWRNYLGLCVRIARAVKRLHAAGLAHSDLSYRNVLVDPLTGGAAVIDIDGLVVPQKYPPDVIGTPDFIAPEVLRTLHLPVTDKGRALPCIETDRHALAVLVYMYLLYRHPLRGGKNHDPDPTVDESMLMGERALFIEHPNDASNRPNLAGVKLSALPFADVSKMPCQIAGPYLKELFHKAFVEGLHDPHRRPSADSWETALVKTVDLLQPCANPKCAQKWYAFDNSTRPACPFCGKPYQGLLPMLNLYSRRRTSDPFKADNHRLMVYSDQYLYPWHVNRLVAPNERLTAEQKKAVGYFVLHQGAWWFVNQTLTGMKDLTRKVEIAPGGKVELTEGLQLLLSPEEGGRLVQVQMVRGI
jgi:hypothetical protein